MLVARSLLISDGIWVVGARLLTALSAMVVQLLLARLLAPADLGGYFIALSLTMPLMVVGQLGLGPIALRETAAALADQAPARAAAVVGHALQPAAIGAVGVLAVTGLAGSLAAFSMTASILCGVWAALLTFQSLLGELLRGCGRPRFAALLNGTLGNLTTLPPLLVFWGSQTALQLPQALLVLIGGVGVAVAVGGFGLWQELRRVQGALPRTARPLAPLLPQGEKVEGRAAPQPASPSPLEMVRQARPLLLNQLLLLVISRTDLWIVSLVGGATPAAGYAIAARLALMVAMPLEVGRSTIAGRIATLHAQGELRRLERLLRATAAWMLIGALPIALICAALGAPLIALIYGPAYTAAAPLLAILALGQLTNVATGLCGQTLTLTGHGSLVLRVTLAVSLASLGLMLVLTSLWGPLAVALATAFAVALRTSLLLIGAKRLVGVWTHAGVPVGK